MRRLRHTDLRLSVLTSLAEGADRIVADVVYATPGAITEVVLPMPQEYYERTFEGPDAVEEFRSMLSRDPHPVIIGDVPASTEERHRAYLDAGRRVVDRCDVLIAIWNGVEKKGAGGTSDVIDYACGMDQAPSGGMSIAAPRKPVIILRTDRALEVELRANGGLHMPGMGEFERINNALASGMVTGRRSKARLDKLLGEDPPDDASAFGDAAATIKERLVPLDLVVEGISTACKRDHERRGTWTYAMAAMAVLFVAIGWAFEPVRLAAFSLEAVMLLTILGVILFARTRATHGRWLQYRFLAERCRVAVYFELLRLPPSVTRPFDQITARTDVAWVVRIFEEVRRAIGAGLDDPPRRDAAWLNRAKSLIIVPLIGGQIDYHAKRLRNFDARMKKFRRLLLASFILALAVALAHLAMVIHDPGAEHGFMGHVMVIASIMLPVAGGSIEGIRAQREYERQAGVSKRMVMELDRLRLRLHTVTREDQMEKVAQEVDRCLMRENAEWLALMFHTDLDLKA